MRILVTGAGGFVGAACVTAAQRAGHEVLAVVRPGSEAWRLPSERVTLVPADLSEPGSVRAAMQMRPDVVVHSAWKGVSAAARQDRRQMADNIASSMAVVEAAIEAGVRKFIGIGSQAEYGLLDGKISEAALPEPNSFYGAAKLAVQVLSKQSCADAGMAFAWLRLFATYGPEDNPHWLIPTLIEQMMRGERPRITTGRQLADYLYIKDVGAAVLAVAEQEAAHGIFNLGSGNPAAVKVIVETIRDIVAPDLELVFGEIPHGPKQVWHMEADISRLTSLAGFRPSTSLDEGLRRTINWHRARLEMSQE